MSRVKDKTDGATGLSRRTREKMGKGNRMTALRLHAGGCIETPPPSLQGQFV